MFKELLGQDYKGVQRLDLRYKFIVEPFVSDFSGKRVLDLACHDGRWSLAFAAAGAEHVVGVEGRPDVLERFNEFPKGDHTDKIELRCNDIFAELESEVAKGARYDVVAIFGIFYHIAEHFRLLNLVRALNPTLIIIDSEFVHDSEFMERPRPIIALNMEATENDLCPIPGETSQDFVAIGTPSFSAMEFMANAIEHSIEWVDWSVLPPDQRQGVRNYFGITERKRFITDPISIKRATCALRPK